MDNSPLILIYLSSIYWNAPNIALAVEAILNMLPKKQLNKEFQEKKLIHTNLSKLIQASANTMVFIVQIQIKIIIDYQMRIS